MTHLKMVVHAIASGGSVSKSGDTSNLKAIMEQIFSEIGNLP